MLEPATPLAQSMVWRLQRTFYGDQGIEAWSRSHVPQSITTSPTITHAYARIVEGYLSDISNQLDHAHPVYVVELGAGSGRFAYRFLKAFTSPPHQKVVYVMTDSSPSVMAYWRQNERLKPFVDAGALIFAEFDIVHLTPLPLETGNPIILIGNYIFDSIPQDAFTIREGQLFKNLVTITADTPELDLTAPDSRVRIGISFEPEPTPVDVEAESDEVLRGLLRGYQRELDDTTVMIPRAAVACVRHFQDLGGGRALCLISDFGDVRVDELQNHGPPGFGASGALWLAVNFHALGKYAEGLGGHARHPLNRHLILNISMLLFGGPESDFRNAHAVYADKIDRFGPDDMALVNRNAAEHMPSLNFNTLLALLRTTGWDPDYLVRAVQFIIDALPNIENRLRPALLQGARTAWEQYYPIGESEDVPFAIGVLLFSLGEYADALQLFELSLRDFGEDPRTTLNLALTLYHLDRKQECVRWLDRTLELDPTNELANQMRPDVLADLGNLA